MKQIYKLNGDWKFKREYNKNNEHMDDYFNMFGQNSKTGISDDERGVSFFDDSWETVSVPHDWCTYFDADPSITDSGHGYKAQGVVWYRRHFTIDDISENQRVFLKFDAIAIEAVIWINGIEIAKSESGYVPIEVEITDFIECGKQNCVSLRVSNTMKEGWWYEGGGIVGEAYLIVSEKSRFKDDGVFIRGEKNNEKWNISVGAEIEAYDENLSVSVNCDELNIKEEKSAEEITELSFETDIKELWDTENPKLYNFTVQLKRDGAVIDEENIKTGFRTVEFDSQKGCFLNGKHIKLNGVCIHHDFTAVGVALTDDIQRYRVGRLKDMGCNAIRCSHNPHQKSLYKICDELGVVVIDEARHFSSTSECMKQLEKFIRRDRNHPCVILWNMFNEEPLQCTITGEKMFRSMKKLVNKLDGTRPVSGAMNGPMESEGVIKEVDLMGFNYIQYEYDEFHKAYPNIPIWGSENSSHLTTRGVVEYNKERKRGRCFTDNYGENLCQWSSNIGDTLRMSDERPFVMGTMDWTGFDYRGESGAYPSTVCNFGSMDLCGFAKDNFYWHKVIWKKEKQIYLSPKWKYKDGEKATFACYSNCDYIVIKQNGNIIYEAKHNMYDRLTVDTVYCDGEITAEGYCNGRLAATAKMQTYGEAAELKMKAESETIVSVWAVDKNGIVVEDADNEIEFTAENGEIVGVGNGDNCFTKAEKTNRVRLFNGKALAVVKNSGELTRVIAKSDGLKSAGITLKSELKNEKTIPAEKARIYVPVWRQSDVHKEYIEERFISDLMFAWIPTTVGYSKNLLYSGKYGFAEVCGQLPLKRLNKGDVCLTFEKIDGDFDIYLDKDLIGSYSNQENLRLIIDTEKCDSPVVSVVFKLNGGECGISGSVYIS